MLGFAAVCRLARQAHRLVPYASNREVYVQTVLSRVIYYVHEVALLKTFYQTHFRLPLVEEIENEWVVMEAGGVEIALHRVGKPYREMQRQDVASNVKLVFAVDSGLLEWREKLLNAGVRMREPKRYEGFPYLMCDGEDPEGNVFQLSQRD
jgi:hypothetical protein